MEQELLADVEVFAVYDFLTSEKCADLIEETGAGLVVPPEDPSEAARRLSDLLTDPSRMRTAREAAASLADERFDRDALASRLRSVLVSVVEHVA